MIPKEHTTRRQAQLPTEENDLSRRYLRMIEKWVRAGAHSFAEWPERPNCGHFLSGCHWYGLETIGPAFALAVASTSNEFDEKAANITRDQLQEMAIKAIRYLCFTHDTGPEDCVRPDAGWGDPRNFGTKWGERGGGFFRESQCGRTTAPLAAISLLLRDRIDAETWSMVARVQADYADRFGAMPPRSGVYANTQMEENAWTAEGLVAAHLFLENHPEAETWEALSRRWMFSTCAAPQDAWNEATLGDSTVRGLTRTALTTLPDYWAENHGMVHPSYTAAGVYFPIHTGCHLRLWGRDLPLELLWNRRRIYENLKIVTDGGGYPQPVQGMDWPYLPLVGNESTHAAASVFFDDGEAAALQLRGLRHAELRQEGNGGYLVNPEIAKKTRQRDRATAIGEVGIRNVAQLHLFHRLLGPGADPVPEDQLEDRLTGVRIFPHAGFVHHRHQRGQTSLSWRNAIMALPLTREGIYTIAPAAGTWLARPAVEDHPDSHSLRSVEIDDAGDSFAAALVVNRCQDALRQCVLFAGLPDGRTLSFERLVASRDLTLASLDQGFLRITNEHFPLLVPNCRGERILYGENGQTAYRGWIGTSEEEDIVDALGQPDWLNIDDRLGLRLIGSGRATYHNRHFFEAYQVLADDLFLSVAECPQDLCPGQEAGILAALLIPDQHHGETADTPFQLIRHGEDGVCLLTNGFLAAANFSDREMLCTFQIDATPKIQIFPNCSLSMSDGTPSYRIRIRRQAPLLLQACDQLEVEGTVQIDATPAGDIFVRNPGRNMARISSLSGKRRELDPDQCIHLD